MKCEMESEMGIVHMGVGRAMSGCGADEDEGGGYNR